MLTAVFIHLENHGAFGKCEITENLSVKKLLALSITVYYQIV